MKIGKLIKSLIEAMKKNKKAVIIGYIAVCTVYLIAALIWPRNPEYADLFSVKKYVMYYLVLLFCGLAVFGVFFNEEKERKNRFLDSTESRWKKTLQWFGKIWKKYKHWIALTLIFCVIAFIGIYVYRDNVRYAMQTTRAKALMEESVLENSKKKSGKPETVKIPKEVREIHQTYICTEEQLVGLGVKFYTNGTPMTGEMSVKIFNRNTGEEICDAMIPMDSVISGEYRGFLFSKPETDAMGEAYSLKIKLPENAREYGLELALAHPGVYEKNQLFLGEQEYYTSAALLGYTDYNTFIKTYFLVIMAALLITAFVIYFMLFIKPCKIETVFLVTVLAVGTIYGFLITPYMVPDEEYHIDMAYRYSNVLMGYGSAPDFTCLKRYEDAHRVLTSAPSVKNYFYIYDNLFSLAEDTHLEQVSASGNTGAMLFMHFPGVIGIILARVLHLGEVPLLVLGRWLGLLAFALMVYIGMKKLPFGKATLFLISIMPITLQQVNSFSYDSVTLGFAFLYTCYILYMAYSEEKIKVRDMALVCALGVALIYCKQGAYSPFVFIFLLIPMKKFASKKTYLCSMTGLAGAAVLAFINKNLAVLTYVPDTSDYVSNAAQSAGAAAAQAAAYIPNYSLGYILKNPKAFLDVMTNTLFDRTEFYVQSLVGQQLGWVEIMISNLIVIVFILLIAFSLFRVRGEKQYLTVGNKWWIVFVCAVSFGLVMVGMLTQWTPVTGTYVEGVQGRYFLPVLFILVLVGRNSKIFHDKSIDRGLIMAACITQVFAVTYLLRAVI